MNSTSKRRRIVAVCVLGSALAGLIASAQEPPRLSRPENRFSETPARKLLENLPPSVSPPIAKSRAAQRRALETLSGSGPIWNALGPFPIPNGQTENRTDPVSGRVTAIAINPGNPAIVYVGTAQGGVYRTLNSGSSWVPLMDNAAPGIAGTPLAIGAVAIDPTNSSTVLVGTGEGNLSGDSFFGSGLYIITNADGTSPIVNGPYALRSDGVDIFTGRSIVAIAIDPANHNNIFCATSSGFGGIVPEAYSVLPPRGLYRSTNAFAGIDGGGTPTFQLLTVQASETNAIMTSVVIEPDNANNLVCALFSQNGTDTGGIYRTTNALATTPTFSRTLALPDAINVKLALNKVGQSVTIYAATEEGDPNGKLYKSTDGGATFTNLPAPNGFAGSQGFYDIAVAVDPLDPNKLYLGGQEAENIFLYSIDGGTSFQSSVTGLHADVHAIAIAPSNTSIIYHGNDGGIWKSTSNGLNWTSLNNSTFSATQFQGLAIHPSDRYFSLGGTQDNGTLLYPDGTFLRADFGDGGYSLIDQNAIDTTNVTMYHTYFNLTDSIIATARVLTVPCAMDGEWSLHGAFTGTLGGPYCDGSFDTHNGIALTDDVNFYATQALGPGNPNTWYFGSNKLYRSVDRADTAAIVSQTFGVPISAIAISPQDDSLRVVGLDDGRVFATSTGSSALGQIAGTGATNGTSSTPATGVGRIAVDPNDSSVAYLCFNGYGTPSNPLAHVWKTTNLRSSVVTFTRASTGLPDLPVNAIAIDGAAVTDSVTTDIYVGTDQGVYYSGDAGANWILYGQGFPRSAVFGLEIQSPSRIVRAATHGRGLYETSTVSTATPTPTPTPEPNDDPSTKVVNLSTRGPVKTGFEVMIAGIIIQGGGTKGVVLRGIGPSMVKSGVSDAIFDPKLSLYNANGSLIASNDDYTTNSTTDRATLATNGLTPSDDRESAIVTSLTPGPYTSILEGTTSGSALVEAYDITPQRANRMVNISTRIKVESGDKGAAIAGFIINTPSDQTSTSQRVVIRVRGPSLGAAGVSGSLGDPTLDFYHGSQLIVSNDSWKSNSQADQDELKATKLAPTNDKEPALVLSLAPGAYSSVVRGKSNTTGVVLVEVYRIGP